VRAFDECDDAACGLSFCVVVMMTGGLLVESRVERRVRLLSRVPARCRESGVTAVRVVVGTPDDVVEVV